MEKSYDLIIIGGGPAGLAAGIYGGRAKLRTLIINKGTFGGMAENTREIVNYPGYLKISGPDLMQDFRKHAESFGIELRRDEVVGVDFAQDLKRVFTKKNQEFQAQAVILAAGCQPRLLNIPGEKEFRGNGVAYCATCDAEFFAGEDVVVVGSGDQAIEEGMFITKFARKVTVIVLHEEGVLDCNKVSAEKAFRNEKMKFIWNSTIEEVLGSTNVEGVKIKNLMTGSSSFLACQGVFFFVGMIPATGFLKNSGLDLEPGGYIPVNELMETNLLGVYAVGDNRVKYLRQVVAAAGDGATAAVAAERYIEEIESFRNNIVNNAKKVLLFFFDARNTESLEFSALLEELYQELRADYALVKVDMATKRNLAIKYGVTSAPGLVVLDKGRKIKQLQCSTDKTVLASCLHEVNVADPEI